MRKTTIDTHCKGVSNYPKHAAFASNPKSSSIIRLSSPARTFVTTRQHCTSFLRHAQMQKCSKYALSPWSRSVSLLVSPISTRWRVFSAPIVWFHDFQRSLCFHDTQLVQVLFMSNSSNSAGIRLSTGLGRIVLGRILSSLLFLGDTGRSRILPAKWGAGVASWCRGYCVCFWYCRVELCFPSCSERGRFDMVLDPAWLNR